MFKPAFLLEPANKPDQFLTKSTSKQQKFPKHKNISWSRSWWFRQ